MTLAILTVSLVRCSNEGKGARAGATETTHTVRGYPIPETPCVATATGQADAVIHLTERTLFSGASLPFTIRSLAAETPTGQVKADCVKVVFVTEGWLHLRYDGGQILLTPGNIVIIPPGLWCSGTPQLFVHTVTIYLQSDFVSGHLHLLPPTHPLLPHLRTASRGERIPQILHIGVENIAALRPSLSALASLTDYTAGRLATLARLANLLHYLAFLCDGPPFSDRQAPPGIPHPHVRAAINAIHARLAHVWTIRELSQMVVLSESQLARLFRRELGTSPAVYVSQARADRMAELLTSERTSIGEAARAVGWPDPSVATRAFKRRYGVSPSQYIMTPTSDQLSSDSVLWGT